MQHRVCRVIIGDLMPMERAAGRKHMCFFYNVGDFVQFLPLEVEVTYFFPVHT